MIEYIQELSPSEAAGIKKTIQDLFRQTCILQVKCDPVTLVQRDNPRYRICANHREFIADYLSVLDCELVHDPHEHIFRIKGEGMPTDRMTLTGTRILLILKVIYRDKIMGEGLNATVTSLEEIREVGRSTNLLARRLTVQEWQDTLTMLRTHQIIELPGAVGSLEDSICSSVELGELIKNYTDVPGDMEDQIEDSMEDPAKDPIQEHQDAGETEEFTSEESKENIYEDVSQ